MKNSKPLFSNRDLAQLIFPLIIEQFLAIMLGIVDIMMVASLGEASVSGVSLVDSINILLFQIFGALGTGGAVVVSQFVGRGDLEKSSAAAKQLIYTIVSISAFIVIVWLIFYRQFLRIVFGNIDDAVMDAAQRYFLITLCALPSTAVYTGCAALFRAQGNSVVSMMSSAFVNLLNIAGNAILLYGFGWGVEGVAMPTFFSRTAAAFVLLLLLHRGKKYHGKPTISIKGISHIEIDWKIIKKILSIGIPNGIEGGTFQVGKILVLSLTSTFGTIAIAANAAASSIASFGSLSGSAIGLAMLTIIGQCVGAGDLNQVAVYTKKLIKLALATMVSFNIFIFCFSPLIARAYNLSEETTLLTVWMARIHATFVFAWVTSFTLPNALRAVNDAKFTMIVSFVSMWTVRVGMCYIFKWTEMFGIQAAMGWPESFGAIGIWLAMILDWIVRSICFVSRFAHGKWKKRAMM